MTYGDNGASVEIVVENSEPRIRLVRGELYRPEILTRDEAAAMLEASYGNAGVARDCDGSCWLCLLDEALDSFA